jgi:hypothetical protein
MKKILLLVVVLYLILGVSFGISRSSSFSDEQILNRIEKNRPSKGAMIPVDIKDRLGATHVGGKYYFTKDPYLIEGCKKMTELGYGVVKLWFRKNPGGYSYNSEWNLKNDVSLMELAQHRYWSACFDMPFSTFALSVKGEGIKTTRNILGLQNL